MTVTTPTEVQMGTGQGIDPAKSQIPDVSLNPRDFQREIQKIAEEKGMEIKDGQAVTKPAPVPIQEAPTQSVADRPQTDGQPIPDKFKMPDGQLDTAKLEKSAVNAEQTLAKYLEKEAELRRKMNEVNNLQKQVQQAPPPTNPQYQQYPQPYPQQPGLAGLTADQVNAAIAKSNNVGQVMLEMAQIAAQTAYNQALADSRVEVDAVKAQVDSQRRTDELREIAKRDPWVFSPEGFKALAEIRDSKPWLNHAPEPWKEAYKDYLAEKALKPDSQVPMPNPTNQTVKAPPTPVSAANRVQSQSLNVSQLSQSRDGLNKFLDSLPPEQQLAFWKATINAKK